LEQEQELELERQRQQQQEELEWEHERDEQLFKQQLVDAEGQQESERQQQQNVFSPTRHNPKSTRNRNSTKHSRNAKIAALQKEKRGSALNQKRNSDSYMSALVAHELNGGLTAEDHLVVRFPSDVKQASSGQVVGGGDVSFPSIGDIIYNFESDDEL
jgi:hypothetical protein